MRQLGRAISGQHANRGRFANPQGKSRDRLATSSSTLGSRTSLPFVSRRNGRASAARMRLARARSVGDATSARHPPSPVLLTRREPSGGARGAARAATAGLTTSRRAALLAALLARRGRHFAAFASRFAQADCDSLLPIGHAAAGATGAQCPFLHLVHAAADLLRGLGAIATRALLS